MTDEWAAGPGLRSSLAYDPRRGTPEAETALAEARQHWVVIIHGSDLPGPDAAEAVAAWDTVASRLQNDGVAGVYNLLDEHLVQYDQVLNADADWGGRPHSPLAWWQWLLVILVVGVAVAALVVCLAWFGCSWIFAAFCAGATIGDWVFSICLGFAC